MSARIARSKHHSIKIQGDAELLSWLLATPVGAALYGLSRDHEAVVQPLPSDKASYGHIFLVGRRRAQKPADVPAVFSGW